MLDRSTIDKLSSYAEDAKHFIETSDEVAAPRQPTLGELFLGLPPPLVRPYQTSSVHAPRLFSSAEDMLQLGLI